MALVLLGVLSGSAYQRGSSGMSGIDGHGGDWTWLRPVAAVAGAIAAGAGAGVGTAYFHEPPRGAAIASADPDLVRRVHALEAYTAGHERDITRRWEAADEKMAGNRGDLDRMRGEVAELRQRVDRVMEWRERGSGGGGGRGSAFVEPAR